MDLELATGTAKSAKEASEDAVQALNSYTIANRLRWILDCTKGSVGYFEDLSRSKLALLSH
jgi:hypothetical protein